MNEKLRQTYMDLRATFPEWGAQKTIGIARSALAMYEEARERLLTQRVPDLKRAAGKSKKSTKLSVSSG